MTGVAPGTIRAVAFGELEIGIWGVAGSSPAGSVSSLGDDFQLDSGAPAEDSLLAAGGLELRFTPTSDAVPFLPSSPGIEGHVQLCEVQGAVRVGGAEREIECVGMRVELTPPSADLASARLAAAWLGPELGTAVVALRPTRARGHESDLVACAFVDDGHALEIEDPRLSTTYTEAGVPLRAGLELWPVEPPEDEAADGEEQDDERPAYYPRRLAGESTQDASRLVLPAATLRAELFRWRTRGREGAGVYVIAPAP